MWPRMLKQRLLLTGSQAPLPDILGACVEPDDCHATALERIRIEKPLSH